MRRYALGSRIIWAPRWAAVLLDEWETITGRTADSASTLVAVVNRLLSHPAEQADYEAYLALLRLGGAAQIQGRLAALDFEEQKRKYIAAYKGDG